VALKPDGLLALILAIARSRMFARWKVFSSPSPIEMAHSRLLFDRCVRVQNSARAVFECCGRSPKALPADVP
jgi:hypothetical protein